MTASKKVVMVPEYDSELNHVFFMEKPPLESTSEAVKFELRRKFFSIYKKFVENRQNLINELRNIADESIRVKKVCNISTITGSSVGIAGGTAAIVGTVVCPPLLLGGLAVAGLGTVSNLGTQLVEFMIFRNMVKKVESLSKYDNNLMHDIEIIHQNILDSELLTTTEHISRSPQSINSATNDLPSLGLQIGAGSTKSATALGLRSVGIEMVEIGSAALRGVARGAIGIGIIIDGVTVFFSSRDLATGRSTKLSDAVNRLADFKEKELGRIMSKIAESDLLYGDNGLSHQCDEKMASESDKLPMRKFSNLSARECSEDLACKSNDLLRYDSSIWEFELSDRLLRDFDDELTHKFDCRLTFDPAATQCTDSTMS